jgi:hypothetical protein
LPVFIPNGRYNGQKLNTLTTTNTAANTKRTIPNVPLRDFFVVICFDVGGLHLPSTLRDFLILLKLPTDQLIAGF